MNKFEVMGRSIESLYAAVYDCLYGKGLSDGYKSAVEKHRKEALSALDEIEEVVKRQEKTIKWQQNIMENTHV